VLLKALDEDGFVFFTNIYSVKGRQLSACSRAAATFLWKASGCQVQLVGPVQQVSDEAADAYFATRDRGSQIGAWASRQSEPLDSRETLLQRVGELESRYEGVEVPRPPYWTGYVLSPETVEFWTQREFRLHDRLLYSRQDGRWSKQRLNP
jgi:pyridoxamine 5'-phosphate oxidase